MESKIDNKLEINLNVLPDDKRVKPNFESLAFGRTFGQHMLIATYDNEKWESAEILPFRNINVSPALVSLHYAQSVFEGLKAYWGPKGEVLIFRPDENYKRFNQSAERMCMPMVPEELFLDGLFKLLEIDKKWIPDIEGFSLYIRPFMFGADEYIGVRPSQKYHFIIFTSPVGSYYSGAVKVKVEEYYVRAVEGGTGACKAAGNYAASLKPAQLAFEQGYHQLLWTDAKTHTLIEESGTMNVMFIIDGKLITPELSGSLLPGITRKSLLQIAKDMGIEVLERKITVEELITAIEQGKVQDAFGTGTAATITPIETIGYKGKDYQLPALDSRVISKQMLETLNNIRTGKVEDKYGWNIIIN